jgi:hypothetical protein
MMIHAMSSGTIAPRENPVLNAQMVLYVQLIQDTTVCYLFLP